MDPDIHVIVIGPNICEGMAGSQRLRNQFFPIAIQGLIRLTNIVISSKIRAENTYVKSYFISFNTLNPFSFLTFQNKGKTIITNQQGQGKNILYVYGYPNIINIGLVNYARRSGYKILFDIVEDIQELKEYRNFLNFLKRKSAVLFFNRIHLISDGSLAITGLLKAKIKQVAPASYPVHILPISVNFNFFRNNSVNNSKKFKIFYGGSLGPKDGLDILLRSLSIVKDLFPNVQLILTGRSSKENFARFNRLVEELNLKNIIDYKGFVKTVDYYRLLNSCNLFCMTRIDSGFANAGFPFKLGEFLATGKPVIVTRIGEIDKYLNTKNSILIKPDDAIELSESIQKIMLHPDLYMEIGEKGRETAMKYFNSEKISEDLYMILKEI